MPWLSRCLGTPHPPYPVTVFSSCRLTLFTWPGGLLLALAAALFALVFALTAQYGFGFKPCVLCLWQRVPYALVLPIALTGFLHVRLKPWRSALLLACALCFLVDAGIAAFHFGVEQRWWLGTTGCAIHASGAAEPATLRLALLASPVTLRRNCLALPRSFHDRLEFSLCLLVITVDRRSGLVRKSLHQTCRADGINTPS